MASFDEILEVESTVILVEFPEEHDQMFEISVHGTAMFHFNRLITQFFFFQILFSFQISFPKNFETFPFANVFISAKTFFKIKTIAQHF